MELVAQVQRRLEVVIDAFLSRHPRVGGAAGLVAAQDADHERR
jgi:hypothetical protein